MNALQNFLLKAAALYLAAPTFCNWIGGLIFAGICALVWFAYWLGGKLSEGQIAELKGKVEVMEQRIIFAKDRADAATKEATDTKTDLEKLKGEIANREPPEILQNSVDALETNVNRLLSANNSTSTTLGFVSTGFNKHGSLNWRPIGEDEKHLLMPVTVAESQKKWMKDKPDE